ALIIDLDNRVNVNVHGNVQGVGQTHASNQGWGPWEVNLGQVLTRGDEWRNLLRGQAQPPQAGRYGGTPGLGVPGAPGDLAPPGPVPHFHSQVDFAGYNEAPGGPSGPLLLPGPAPLLSCDRRPQRPAPAARARSPAELFPLLPRPARRVRRLRQPRPGGAARPPTAVQRLPAGGG